MELPWAAISDGPAPLGHGAQVGQDHLLPVRLDPAHHVGQALGAGDLVLHALVAGIGR